LVTVLRAPEAFEIGGLMSDTAWLLKAVNGMLVGGTVGACSSGMASARNLVAASSKQASVRSK
jgi:hypothetical protein